MRILFPSYSLLVSTLFISIFAFSTSANASGGEDYYKELRKLKKFDPATLDQIRRKTVDAEQIKKANELSKANSEHTARVEAKKVKRPTVDPNEGKAPGAGPKGEKIAKEPQIKPGTGKPATTTTASKAPKPTESKKSVVKRPSSSDSSSAPIKVESNVPDELSFPGDSEEKK